MEWWLSTQTNGEPWSQTAHVKQISSLGKYRNAIVFMEDLGPCPLRVHIVLWGHSY